MKSKLKLCIPVYDIVEYERGLAKASIDALDRSQLDFTVQVCQGCVIELQRNLLIQPDEEAQAIRQEIVSPYTHYLFIDHDVGFTTQDIVQLLSDDLDIVSGCYRPKDKPQFFVAGYMDEKCRITGQCSSALKPGLHKIGWAGGGLLLVKREVFGKMEYPWFGKKVSKFANRAVLIGEDVYFCDNARQNLIDVWLDTRVIINHESNRYTNTHEKVSNPIDVK